MTQTLLETLKQRQKDNSKVPEYMPLPGDPEKMWAIYVWGVPNLVASPKVPMPCMVTSTDPATGRANGWAIADPSMKAQDDRGGVQPFPPLVPFEGALYNDEPTKGCWMHREDFHKFLENMQKEAVEKASKAEEAHDE